MTKEDYFRCVAKEEEEEECSDVEDEGCSDVDDNRECSESFKKLEFHRNVVHASIEGIVDEQTRAYARKVLLQVCAQSINYYASLSDHIKVPFPTANSYVV